jgi:hypothetical protein
MTGKKTFLKGSMAALVLVATPACAAGSGSAPGIDIAALTLPPISASSMTVDGRTYTIFVTRPPKPAPPEGYPLLVVLDANLNFATAASSAWGRASFADIAPIVVVGIGYPTGDQPTLLTRRVFDFTEATASRPAAPSLIGKSIGGAETFRQGVVAAVLRKMDREEDVNPRCHVLFGQSLGGLFTVNTLFLDPNMFEGYFAASPSVHINAAQLYDKDQWTANLKRLTAPVRVHLAVGELESKRSERELKAFPEYRNAPNVDMVANMERVADLLSGLKAPNLAVSSEVLANESHASEVPRLTSEAVTFTAQCPNAKEAP